MKPARNQSCPCGSGKKFKRCCGQGKNHLNEVPLDIYQTFQLALAHHAAGELNQAAESYRSVITMKALPEAYNNLGNVLKDQGKISEATRCYQQALKLKPVYADAEYNLADALQTERRYEDAVTHYRRALKLSPDDIEALAGYVHTLQQICEWSEINMLSKRLLELIAKPDSRAVSPFSLLSLPSDLRLQQDNARKASRYVKRNIGAVAPSSRATVRSNRLRIGYLSADFHDHPTSYLIAELLELH
ncbi:MAG: tetratricopeptide repeat protein, partial [Pyrinomonadaceae bacterium]